MTRLLAVAQVCLSLALCVPSATGQDQTQLEKQVRMLGRADETVRKRAQLALVKAGDRAITPLVDALEGGTDALRKRVRATLRQICSANVRTILHPGGRDATLTRGRIRPTVFSGPFRIRIDRLRRSWRKVFGEGSSSQTEVELRIDWGRGFRLLGHVGPVRKLVARDDLGIQLVSSPGPRGRVEWFFPRTGDFDIRSAGGGVPIRISLRPYSQKASQIQRLSGQQTLVFVKQAREVRIPAPDKLQRFKLSWAGGFYELRSIRRRGDGVGIESRFEVPRFTIPLKPAPGYGRNMFWSKNRFYVQYLVDQDGKRYRSRRLLIMRRRPEQPVATVKAYYRIPASKRLVAVVLHYVQEIEVRRVSFEFKDIPLR